MSFAISAVKPDDVKGFVGRNGGLVSSRNVVEVWAAYLAGNGGSGTRLPELEATYLSSRGAVGARLVDLWSSYLKQNGYASVGNLQDQIRVYFTSGNDTGSPTPVSSDRLLEDSSFTTSYRLLEDGSTRLLEA